MSEGNVRAVYDESTDTLFVDIDNRSPVYTTLEEWFTDRDGTVRYDLIDDCIRRNPGLHDLYMVNQGVESSDPFTLDEFRKAAGGWWYVLVGGSAFLAVVVLSMIWSSLR